MIGLEGLGVDIHKKLVNDGVVKKTSFSEFNELFDERRHQFEEFVKSAF